MVATFSVQVRISQYKTREQVCPFSILLSVWDGLSSLKVREYQGSSFAEKHLGENRLNMTHQCALLMIANGILGYCSKMKSWTR